MLALVDCNNFFVSCERVFDPSLVGRAVAVLSSNDGCIIARSNEVKAMGVAMGAPLFKYRDLCIQNQVVLKSSNFQLYRDMSLRVMAILKQFSPTVDVYSIDEAFLEAPLVKSVKWGEEIKTAVARQTGLPISVGVASTHTLCKVAAYLAKRDQGSFSFAGLSEVDIDEYLAQVPVEAVWGVGRQLSKSLKSYRVKTALGLKYIPEPILRRFDISLRRLVLELRGIPCRSADSKEISQTIISTRSFGDPVTSRRGLSEAISMHAAQVGAKLRRQGATAGRFGVMIGGSGYSAYRQAQAGVAVATNDSRQLIAVGQKLLREVYVEGRVYKKAGFIAYKIVPSHATQLNLIDREDNYVEAEQVNKALDRVNAKWGPRTLKLASEGLHQPWQSKCLLRSPCYTTKWSELQSVK